MYMTTRDGLGQAPRLFGSFAGTLGRNPRPSDAQRFLEEVRKRPRDYKRLLLTVTLHPDPEDSNIEITVPGTHVSQKWIDFVLLHGIRAAHLDELRRMANESFRRQIEAELQLRNTMFKTTGRLVGKELLRTRGKVSKKLEPFLLEASAPGFNIPITQAKLGLSFAQQMLPSRLAGRINQSEASEAHLTNLGKLLGRYAEELQKKDADFKRLVEQRKKP